jgi:hypothetical protein
MSTYVIKSWRASDRPDAQNNFVSITGRRKGLTSWLLSAFGIDPTVSITVSENRIEFAEGSLSGNVRRLIPFSGVCSTLYGYHKPWKKALLVWLLLTPLLPFLFTLLSQSISELHSVSDPIAPLTIILSQLLAIIIAGIYYFLNITLTLGFVENSGVINLIEFKRSVIENKEINEAQVGYVCQVIQYLIEAKVR